MKKYEKQIFLGLFFLILSFIVWAILHIGAAHKETMYCGRVVLLYKEAPGYKSSIEHKHVLFYSDSLKRNVDVYVTNNTYANTIIGETTCFSLTEHQLKE